MARTAVPHVQCSGKPLTTFVLICAQLQVSLLVSGCVLDAACCSRVAHFGLREDVAHMPCRSFPPESLQPRAPFWFVSRTKVLLHAPPLPQAPTVTTLTLNLVAREVSSTCSLHLYMTTRVDGLTDFTSGCSAFGLSLEARLMPPGCL